MSLGKQLIGSGISFAADKLLNQTILKLKNFPAKPEGNFWIKTIIGSNPDPEWKEYLISA